MSDPLPQALILTAIVITFGISAFVLAMIHRSWALARNEGGRASRRRRRARDDEEDADRRPARRRRRRQDDLEDVEQLDDDDTDGDDVGEPSDPAAAGRP